MVNDHSDSERGNPLPPLLGLLLSINSKGSFICTIPQTGLHIPRPFFTPVVEHWLELAIVQWIHHELKGFVREYNKVVMWCFVFKSIFVHCIVNCNKLKYTKCEACNLYRRRASARDAMGRRVDPSWWIISVISPSSQCSTTGVTKDVVCYKRTLPPCCGGSDLYVK